jgi:hypothetical protein
MAASMSDKFREEEWSRRPGQQLSRQSKVSTDQGGMTHESTDNCSPAVPRLECARSRGYVRLRQQRRGRRYRDVHAASGRFAAAGTALQGGKARDADGGEPGQALPHAAVRSKPFQAYSYSIDKSSGVLNFVGTGTLAESYPYIAFDRSGRFLLARPMVLTKWA